MSVIIMYPKHNLEMKYKNGEEGYFLFLGSCCKAECEIPDHDVMKMVFSLGKHSFHSKYRT